MSYDLQDLFPTQDQHAEAGQLQLLDFDFSEFLNNNQDSLEHNDVFAPYSDLSVGGDFDFSTFEDLSTSTGSVIDNTTTTKHGYDTQTAPASLAAAGPSDTSTGGGVTAPHHDTSLTTASSEDFLNGLLHGTVAPSNTSTTLTPPPSTNGGSQKTSPMLGMLPEPKSVSPDVSASPDDEPDTKKRKRERNTEAARRYRQRRQDRLEELEEALAAMTKDRDGLRLKLARAEAEADILRGLMAKKG